MALSPIYEYTQWKPLEFASIKKYEHATSQCNCPCMMFLDQLLQKHDGYNWGSNVWLSLKSIDVANKKH